MLLVTRPAVPTQTAWPARFVRSAGFIPCFGGRDAAEAAALAAAFRHGGMWGVQSLQRGTAPDASAWCAGNGWWLSTAPRA